MPQRTFIVELKFTTSMPLDELEQFADEMLEDVREHLLTARGETVHVHGITPITTTDTDAAHNAELRRRSAAYDAAHDAELRRRLGDDAR